MALVNLLIFLLRTRRTCKFGHSVWWRNHSKAGTQIARVRPARSTRMLLGRLSLINHFTNKICHRPHKVTQYKKGKDSLFAQGKRRYDRKQSGYGGQTKPVFHKKVRLRCSFLLGINVLYRQRQPRKSCCDWSAQYVNTRCSSRWSAANSKSRILPFISVNVSLLVASNSVVKRRPRVQLSLSYVHWYSVHAVYSLHLVIMVFMSFLCCIRCVFQYSQYDYTCYDPIL